MSTYAWSKVTNANGFNFKDAQDNWASALDPYLVWAYVTNFEYLRPPQIDAIDPCASYVPIAIELDTINLQDFIAVVDTVPGANLLSISDLYRRTPAALEEAHFLTAYARVPEFFDSLNPGGVLCEYVKRFELGLAIESQEDAMSIFNLSQPLPGSSSRNSQPPALLADDLPMSQLNVNLTVIDDGIGFINNTLLTKNDSSRVHYFWNQNALPPHAIEKLDEVKSQQGLTSTLLSDIAVSGWQIGKDEIEQWTTKVKQHSISEAAVYNAYEYYAIGNSVSHGTHILDTAVGFDYDVDSITSSQDNARLDATNIVAVQLGFPTRKFADSSGRWLSFHLLNAVRYGLLRGDQLTDSSGKINPMVFNISMGNLAGPHDGSSIFESALDELLKLRNNAIDTQTNKPRKNRMLECVLSSGNQRAAKSHAKFTVKRKSNNSIVWRVLPDDSTPSFMELWIPESHVNRSDCKKISIKIEPPTGKRHSSKKLKCGKTWVLRKDNIAQCVTVYLPPEKLSTGRNGMILIALAPTNNVLNKSTIQPGEWKITVQNKSKANLTISAWIQRDETTFDRPTRGRQSHFVDNAFKQYDEFGYPNKDDTNNNSTIRLKGTISAIATGSESLSIGAYRYSDDAQSPYSGLGGAGIKPAEPLAVADDSITCHGTIAAGSFSGSRVALDGTSVAAAQATRYLLTTGSIASNNNQLPSSDAETSAKKRRIGHRKRGPLLQA